MVRNRHKPPPVCCAARPLRGVGLELLQPQLDMSVHVAVVSETARRPPLSDMLFACLLDKGPTRFRCDGNRAARPLIDGVYVWLVSVRTGFAIAPGSCLQPIGSLATSLFPRPPVDGCAAHPAGAWTAPALRPASRIRPPAPRGRRLWPDAPRGGLPQLREKATPNPSSCKQPAAVQRIGIRARRRARIEPHGDPV